MGVSKNNGTPKSSILIGFSIINHPFGGTPNFGNTHITLTQTMHYFSEKILQIYHTFVVFHSHLKWVIFHDPRWIALFWANYYDSKTWIFRSFLGAFPDPIHLHLRWPTGGDRSRCNLPRLGGHLWKPWTFFLAFALFDSPLKKKGNMGVSKNRGFTPQIINFNRVFHYKPSILGAHPYFWKHPYHDPSRNVMSRGFSCGAIYVNWKGGSGAMTR